MCLFSQSSVRHNLSSNRGFKKVERGPDEKGKGALWTVDPLHEHTFEEQEAKRLQTKAREVLTEDDFGLGDAAEAISLEQDKCVTIFCILRHLFECIQQRSRRTCGLCYPNIASRQALPTPAFGKDKSRGSRLSSRLGGCCLLTDGNSGQD